jgi:Holliday junction resolvase
MSNASFGHARERKVAAQLGEDGWFVLRAAGSLGVADLIALKAGRKPMMLEVKATSRGPFAGFPPADRQELIAVAKQSGALPFLVHWPKHGKAKWYGVEEWPGARQNCE